MSKNQNMGTCALCKKENIILEESHIIPKFVFRAIKKDSPTGGMRNPYNPDKRVQDGDKQYLLCGECEDLFNKSETEFANKIFHPYRNDELKKFNYEEWLNFFITSVNWRILYLDLNNENTFTSKVRQILSRNEEVLRDFIMGRRQDIGNIENHIFFFDKITDASEKIVNCGPNVFFKNSSFGYTTAIDKKSIYIITNLCGILIITILKRPNDDKWENTIVNIDKGFFEVKDQHIQSRSMDNLFKYMEKSKKAQENISEKQRERIKNMAEGKESKILQSKILKNMQLDENLKNKKN